MNPRTVHRSSPASLPIATLTMTTLLNFVLAGIAVTFLVAYVVNANATAANQYLMKSLDERTQTLSEERVALSQQQAELENPSLLASQAESQGMVSASDISYIFANSNVAYQK